MIFTERTITIRKGASKINEPVILYRGDYEVEVRFTIMDSKFRFLSGVNVIDSEKASYAQLAILTPYGGNIFSEVTKCNDGAVTFLISKAMLDQIEEVGLYSFQIRLFDYNRESRASIPPVEFGLEFREPITSEDHDNSVNNAIVGYSIAKIVDPKEENVGPTFDGNGNYNETKWETGDRITEGKLNKIEDAISTVNKNSINNNATLDKKVTSNFNVLDSTKADLTYVDTQIRALAAGGPKGVYASLSALQTAIPNGNSNIYLTSNNGHWNYWNGSTWVSGGVYQSTGLDKGSVTQEHISGGVKSINLFNVGQLKGGYINSADYVITSTDSIYRYAAVPVEPNTTYLIGRDLPNNGSNLTIGDPFLMVDQNGAVLFQDKFYGYRAGTDKNGLLYAKVTTVDNTAYIYINARIGAFNVTYPDGIFVVDAINVPEGELPSLKTMNAISDIFGTKLLDSDLRVIFNDFIASIKSQSRDIAFKELEILENYLVNTTPLLQALSGWTAGRIPVKPNTEYSIWFESQIYASVRGDILFQSKEKTDVGYAEWETISMVGLDKNGSFVVLTTPVDAYYMCFTLKGGPTAAKPFDDRAGVVVVEGVMNDGDLENLIYELHGSKIFTPDMVTDYYHIPKIGYSGSTNMFKLNDVVVHNNTLYDNKASRTGATGWKCVDIPAQPNHTYYLYSPSNEFKVTNRGAIVLLNSGSQIISPIEGQDEYYYVDNQGYRWQVINTTFNTTQIGVTVGAPDNRFDDLETGVLVSEQPASPFEPPYITKIDDAGLQADSISMKALNTSWENNPIYNRQFIRHDDYLYNNDGLFQSARGWVCIDIPVTGGETYYLYLPSQRYGTGERGRILLLDADSNVISPIEGQNEELVSVNNYKWQVVKTTSNTAYVGVTMISAFSSGTQYRDLDGSILVDHEPSSSDMTNTIIGIGGLPIGNAGPLDISVGKPLQGKKWVVIGDSLTERNIRATKFYHDYVAEELGCTVVNMGVSGTGYMKRQENGNAFYQRILNIPADADIITIFGSGNDLSLTLGTPADRGEDTICGCMHLTIQNLFTVIPGAKIGIVLPCPWGSYPPASKGNKMDLYCEALKEIAAEYSIPVLDLYHGSNLRPWEPTFRDLFYTRDGGNTVHPDENGHAILSNKFKMFIQGL